MKKLRSLIKRFFSRKRKKSSPTEELETKREQMKAELESLSEFENFLKELTKQQ